MTTNPIDLTAFFHGYNARSYGCYRILCCPESAEQEAEWKRGWDARDAELRSASQ